MVVAKHANAINSINMHTVQNRHDYVRNKKCPENASMPNRGRKALRWSRFVDGQVICVYTVCSVHFSSVAVLFKLGAVLIISVELVGFVLEDGTRKTLRSNRIRMRIFPLCVLQAGRSHGPGGVASSSMTAAC